MCKYSYLSLKFYFFCFSNHKLSNQICHHSCFFSKVRYRECLSQYIIGCKSIKRTALVDKRDEVPKNLKGNWTMEIFELWNYCCQMKACCFKDCLEFCLIFDLKIYMYSIHSIRKKHFIMQWIFLSLQK